MVATAAARAELVGDPMPRQRDRRAAMAGGAAIGSSWQASGRHVAVRAMPWVVFLAAVCVMWWRGGLTCAVIARGRGVAMSIGSRAWAVV